MPPADAPAPSPRDAFLRMLAAGKDGALLRYSLGNEFFKAGDAAAAIEHLQRAVALDDGYTAAWKLLGKALASAARDADALAAYRRGIEVAHQLDSGERAGQDDVVGHADPITGEVVVPVVAPQVPRIGTLRIGVTHEVGTDRGGEAVVRGHDARSGADEPTDRADDARSG